MKYWFVFCKTDILLQQLPDGSHTVPCQDEPPVPTQPWTTIHRIGTLHGHGSARIVLKSPPHVVGDFYSVGCVLPIINYRATSISWRVNARRFSIGTSTPNSVGCVVVR